MESCEAGGEGISTFSYVHLGVHTVRFTEYKISNDSKIEEVV
jgi:hypothetical protein